MNKPKIIFIILLCIAALCLLLWLFKGFQTNENSDLEKEEALTNERILGVLQSQAQIASTEVSIRKIAIYDSESDKISLNPSTWKIGHRLCVVPVDIKIKYGIDLNEMQPGDIARPDSSDVVLIRLPNPKILDKSYVPQTNQKEIITLATGLRDNIGETTIQQIKTLAFEDVVEKDEMLHKKLSTEITNNTKSVFKSLMKSMGLTTEFIN